MQKRTTLSIFAILMTALLLFSASALTVPTAIASAGLPDLTVTTRVTFDPAEVAHGDEISVAFTVKNRGDAASGSFHLRVSLSTRRWGTRHGLGNFPVASLGPGASRPLTITTNPIPSTVPAPGDYYVTVFVDGFKQVTESNEDNNIGSSTPSRLRLLPAPPPDPTITSAHPSPSTAAAGERTTITYNVANPGPTRTVLLGAGIQLPGRSPLSDPANDRQVAIVSGSSTDQRSFVIPADAPPGRYNLLVSLVEDVNNNGRIDARDRHLASRTFTGALQVTPPAPPPVYFDFSLSVTPTSGKVTRGEMVSTIVTATLTSGTTQPVSFSVTGLPSGVSVNALSSGSPTISRGVAFTAASNAVLGTHIITITASGGGITRTASYTLTVLGHDEEIHIFEIEPSQGVAGDVVTIKGVKFSKLPLWAEVIFGGQRVEILSRYTETLPNEIVVEVPVLDLRSQRDKAVDVYLAYGFPILYVQTSNKVKFIYEQPVLTDISPSRTMPNRQVTLTGDYFGDGERGGPYFVKFGAERFYATSEKVRWSNNRIVMKAPPSLGLGGAAEARAIKALLSIIAIGKNWGWGLVETIAPEVVDRVMPPGFIQPVPVSDEDEAWLLWVRSFIAEALPGFDITLAGDLTVRVRVITPVAESEPRYFTFTREWVPINGELYWTAASPDIILHGHSPAEFRVYDSQGRVTGLVEGELKEEIPNSLSVRNAVFIFDATDSYRFEVVGTDEGTYGINLISVGEEVTIVGVTQVPTSERIVHRYTINWDALLRGEPSISVQIDSDGDEIFEQTKILQPPIVSFAYSPEKMIADQPITFDASGSSDPDGEIISYEWDFRDGTTGTGKVIEHGFSVAGDYMVTLTVTDNDGVVNSFSKIVEVVLPRAPDIRERLLGIGERLLGIGERLLAFAERLLAQLIQLVQANPWIAAGIVAVGLLILVIKRRVA